MLPPKAFVHWGDEVGGIRKACISEVSCMDNDVQLLPHL